MKVLAITGGIGSGKSYVINIFKHLGIPFYSTDERTKKLYDDPDLLKSIAKVVGEDIILNGVLQKKIFASRIFSSKDILHKVEEIVHPLVLNDFNKWKKEIESKNDNKIPFVIIESAIFLEKPLFRNQANKVALVSAPEELRIERTIKRDGCSAEDVKKRMDKQWSEEKRMKYVDFVIYSDSRKLLLAQVLEVYNEMKK